MTRPSFGIYYSDPAAVPESELKWEIDLQAAEDRHLEEPLKLKQWNFTICASMLYAGSISGKHMENSYIALFNWISKNKYTPAGPIMERYLRAPRQNENGEWIGLLQILVPVQKVLEEPMPDKKWPDLILHKIPG